MKWREIFIFHYKSKHPSYVPASHSTITSILSCFRFTSGHRTFGCVDHNKLWKTLREMGISDHLTCLLRNLYVGQEATVISLYGTTDQLKIEKGVWQGCLLSPCLCDFYAEHIVRNARLDESQAGIKTGGRNSPMNSKEIKPVNLKGNQPRILIGRTDVEVETLVFWSSDTNSWLMGKIEGRRKRGCQRMRWLDGITDVMGMN